MLAHCLYGWNQIFPYTSCYFQTKPRWIFTNSKSNLIQIQSKSESNINPDSIANGPQSSLIQPPLPLTTRREGERRVGSGRGRGRGVMASHTTTHPTTTRGRWKCQLRQRKATAAASMNNRSHIFPLLHFYCWMETAVPCLNIIIYQIPEKWRFDSQGCQVVKWSREVSTWRFRFCSRRRFQMVCYFDVGHIFSSD